MVYPAMDVWSPSLDCDANGAPMSTVWLTSKVPECVIGLGVMDDPQPGMAFVLL